MKTIPYKISQIKTLQFAIFPDNYVNGEDVNIEASFNFAHNESLDNIRCIADFKYCQKELLLTSETQCIFHLSPEGVQELINEHVIPKFFLRYMATIVTGTVRGIIHSKTEGTLLNSIVLPPIDLTQLITEDIKIDK